MLSKNGDCYHVIIGSERIFLEFGNVIATVTNERIDDRDIQVDAHCSKWRGEQFTNQLLLTQYYNFML